MPEIVIVGSARTPVGSFQGTLAGVAATELGATAIRAALDRAKCAPDSVDDVIMGNVLSAGLGQGPARQAAISAGVPVGKAALTVNKLCGSGMMSVVLGARSILLGDNEVVVAGGMESMSRSPYLLQGVRGGWKMGSQQVIDSVLQDGLLDAYSQQHMGQCAEACARKYQFTREQQDSFAIESFRRAQATQKDGKFQQEISPVNVTDGKGASSTVELDEGPGKARFDKIPTLKPVFDKAGTITAANASTLNDGAAALVLMSDKKTASMGCKPVARIVAWAIHSQEPLWFTTAPISAISKVLKKAQWSADQVDLFEINEAFAVVTLAAMQELNLPHEKVNVRGGAIALGHPIGASGARVLVTLLAAMTDQGKRRGVASLCIGGGEGIAMAVELV